jgi:hypothetical protein
MNLNKTQIEALADSFRTTLLVNRKAVIDKEKEKIILKYKSLFEKSIELLKNNKFITQVRVNLDKGYTTEINLEDTLANFISDYTLNNLVKTDIEIPTLSSLKNDIILATIDSTSVEEIMNTLKLKYK